MVDEITQGASTFQGDFAGAIGQRGLRRGRGAFATPPGGGGEFFRAGTGQAVCLSGGKKKKNRPRKKKKRGKTPGAQFSFFWGGEGREAVFPRGDAGFPGNGLCSRGPGGEKKLRQVSFQKKPRQGGKTKKRATPCFVGPVQEGWRFFKGAKGAFFEQGGQVFPRHPTKAPVGPDEKTVWGTISWRFYAGPLGWLGTEVKTTNAAARSWRNRGQVGRGPNGSFVSFFFGIPQGAKGGTAVKKKKRSPRPVDTAGTPPPAFHAPRKNAIQARWRGGGPGLQTSERGAYSPWIWENGFGWGQGRAR